MWELYVKYALPIFALSIVGISFFRLVKQYKKEENPKNKTKIKKTFVISIVGTFLLITVFTMIIINKN